MIAATPAEQTTRSEIVSRVLQFVQENRTIRLPDFNKALSHRSDEYALVSVGLENNPFGAAIQGFRYQFEGEEDLLHLIVTRLDGGPLTAEEGQQVAGFVLEGVPTSLIWLKPGQLSQHFFVGHDDLIGNITA